MTEGITILRRDGTVLFRSQTATTVEEAVRELVAEARADLSNVDLRFADLSNADLRYADLRNARNVPLVLTVGPVDGWTLSLINTTEGWRFDAGCRHFTEVQARSHWSNSLAWSKGAAPEHGARMLAGVDALIALATAMGWPEKLVVESNQEETT